MLTARKVPYEARRPNGDSTGARVEVFEGSGQPGPTDFAAEVLRLEALSISIPCRSLPPRQRRFFDYPHTC